MASSAAAQAFNIDFAGNLSQVPEQTYGAGSGQSGFWNAANGTTSLKDVSGNLTAATFGGASSAGLVEIAGATGDDERLMESMIFFPKNAAGVSFSNVEPAVYDLYTYGWNDTFFHAHTIGIDVFNSVSHVGGIINTTDAWPAGQILGQTYARIRVEVLPGVGFLRIKATNATDDYEVLSGIQLVPVPVPGAVLPLLGAALLPRSKRSAR